MIAHRTLLAACVAGAAVFVPAKASAQIVMEFPDHQALAGQIPLSSYAWERSAPPLAKICTGAGGSGRFTITKPVDAASPQLAEDLKAHKAEVVQLSDTQADGKRVAFQFTNAVVSSIKPETAGDKAMETIEFNYSAIQWLTVGCAPPPAARARAGRDIAPAARAGGGYGNGY